jgi:hypothetical protein
MESVTTNCGIESFHGRLNQTPGLKDHPSLAALQKALYTADMYKLRQNELQPTADDELECSRLKTRQRIFGENKDLILGRIYTFLDTLPNLPKTGESGSLSKQSFLKCLPVEVNDDSIARTCISEAEGTAAWELLSDSALLDFDDKSFEEAFAKKKL